jgi:drug/metabolite transporter (DMT)-like permease
VSSLDSKSAAAARRRADLALLVVTLLWSTSFALIKGAMNDLSPVLLTGLRFAITCAVMWPMLLRVRGDARAWRDGVGLGILLAGCYLTQVTGLRTTTAGNSAFVTSTCTLMVPFVDYALRRRRPARATVLGILLAMGGVWLLLNPRLGAFNRGDLWTLACAFLYAVYLVQLDTALRRSPFQVVLYGQMVMVALLALALSPFVETPHFAFTPAALRALAIVAFGATAAALYLQNRFQSQTTPTRAALIYLGEPVFAAFFAWLHLKEVLTARAYLGGAIVLGGILISELAGAGEPSAQPASEDLPRSIESDL